MRTFAIQTLGCRVNHYESRQLAALLESRGMVETALEQAQLRIVHTCSVTVEAASKSGQMARRLVRLPVLPTAHADRVAIPAAQACSCDSFASVPLPDLTTQDGSPVPCGTRQQPKVVITGCWATSHPDQARQIPGVVAVLGHHQNVAQELTEFLNSWQSKPTTAIRSEAQFGNEVKGKLENDEKSFSSRTNDAVSVPTGNSDFTRSGAPAHGPRPAGTVLLPLLHSRQNDHQRAFLKIQDGCDAHCTYCIIPSLRPNLWSKSIDEALDEARRLVDAGHLELVLTGIFLGAFGQSTALHRRQDRSGVAPLGRLIEALCAKVGGLKRLRLSSLEPGDLDDSLLAVLKSHQAVVPHFHLPLQSGSAQILRRMNRQYTPDDFRRMIERIKHSFDRPALTTDIIVAFPGETEECFDQTIRLSEESNFIHIHAFPFSPRPGTAAGRWKKLFVGANLAARRIDRLAELARRQSETFRKQFLGQTIELLVENPPAKDRRPEFQHGRSERYFDVHFENQGLQAGTLARIRIDHVSPNRTLGTFLGVEQ